MTLVNRVNPTLVNRVNPQPFLNETYLDRINAINKIAKHKNSLCDLS
jgi:hypothetical protein